MAELYMAARALGIQHARVAIQTCSRGCANEVLIPAQVRSAPKVEESPSDRRSLSSENAIWRQAKNNEQAF